MLATTSAGKVREFRELVAAHLDPARVQIATPDELGLTLPPVEESGATFTENALLKARAVAHAAGLPALADDSGLCVDALSGRPGLHSARWAGSAATDADRCALLLQRLQGVPAKRRAARFVCVVALALPDGTTWTAEGTCEGIIAAAPCGAQGFGYDPVFLVPALGITFAELSDAEKNRLSHRALALAALAPRLKVVFNNGSGWAEKVASAEPECMSPASALLQ